MVVRAECQRARQTWQRVPSASSSASQLSNHGILRRRPIQQILLVKHCLVLARTPALRDGPRSRAGLKQPGCGDSQEEENRKHQNTANASEIYHIVFFSVPKIRTLLLKALPTTILSTSRICNPRGCSRSAIEDGMRQFGINLSRKTCRCRTGRRPNNKIGFNDNSRLKFRLPLNPVDQYLCGDLSHSMQRLTDSSQFRIGKYCRRYIIKTNHRDVLGHIQSGFTKCHDCSDCSKIVISD